MPHLSDYLWGYLDVTGLRERLLMDELGGAGLLAEAGLEQARDDGFAVAARGLAGGGGVEAIEDEEVALGVVHGGEGGDALEMVGGG